MKRLAIFPHIISVVNLEKMSRRLWILGDFFLFEKFTGARELCW